MSNLLVQENNLKSIANAIRDKNDKISNDTLLTFPNDFITNISNIETGVPLNFKIIGGTTKPQSPQENTIWVNTSEKEIKNWAFSSTKPTNPINNMIWFNIGIESPTPINLFKQNIAIVYPLSCKQYLSGTWTSRNVETYQNSTWKPWATYLFSDGAYGHSINGMTKYAKFIHDGAGGVYGTRTAEINSHGQLHIYNNGNYTTGMAVFTNLIDVTPFEKLIVLGRTSISDGYNISVYSSIGTYARSNVVASAAMATSKQTEITIDLSKITGTVYIGFAYLDNPNVTEYFIDEVRLE